MDPAWQSRPGGAAPSTVDSLGCRQVTAEEIEQGAPMPLLGRLVVDAGVGHRVAVDCALVDLSPVADTGLVQGRVEALDLLGRQRRIVVRVSKVEFGRHGAG